MDALTSWISRSPVTGWDVLDVLVVALIIYESLKLIRGTRAMQMAFGSALLVGLYFFSLAAPLQTVNWLIRNMIGYVVFAAIVLFQNDIRRALAHFGRTPFVRAFSRAENDDETIEEVVTAAVQMADRKTGALIVIERQIGLRNYIESGIPLDAMVTHDLLVTVFQTSGPLHDGAVIIQENKLAAASCFLPLTVSSMVGTDLGTRHRAAIGLTEENDAVAVVVSEETGRISIATEGQISRGFTAETLRARLTQLVLQRKSARRTRPLPLIMTLRILSNLPLKVISLLVAVVLWLAVSGQSTVERNIRVPLERQNVPPGMEIVGEPPASVDVRLRGSSGNLSRVAQGDVVAALDLTNARPGTRIFDLRASEVRVPFGVEVVQVTPPTVSLDFEYSGTKVVPVSPVIEGDPEPGFVVGQITTSPATVQVLGPVGHLGALREATTEPVRVDGARESVTDRVTVGVEDSAVRLREPQVAVVTVEIVPAPVQQTLPGVEVRTTNLGRGLSARVTPASVSVLVRGTRERIAGLGSGDLLADVDLTDLARGQHSLPVRVPNREGVAVERIDPATVTVSIR